MDRKRRWTLARVFAGAALIAVLGTQAVVAAGPTRDVVDLNDPAIDAGETAWASALCGFPVEASVGGHIGLIVFPGTDGRSVFELDTYAIRISYTNPATGITIRLRDVGPDRFFVKDGLAYVAVTGRSLTGTGVVGIVVFDLDTDEIVHQAGNEVGLIYDTLCVRLAGG